MPDPCAITLGGRAFDLAHRGLVVGVAGDDAGVVARLAAEGADAIEVSEALVDGVAELVADTGLPVIVTVGSGGAARVALGAGAAAIRLGTADAALAAEIAADAARWSAPKAATSAGERGAAHLIAPAGLLRAAQPAPVATVVELSGVEGLAGASSARPGQVLSLDDGTAAARATPVLDEVARGRLVGLHVAAAVRGVRMVRTTQVRTVRRALDVLAAVTSARRARLGP